MTIRFVPVLVVLACVSALSAQQSTHASSAEDRKRLLAMVDDLENNPLGPKAQGERNTMAYYLLQSSDLHVNMCSRLLGDLRTGPGTDSEILVMQPTYSSTRYAIEHDGGNGSSLAQYQAGVLGTLKTYENMVKAKPADRQPLLDDLLKKRANGTLNAYVKVQVEKSCVKKAK